MLCLLKKVQKVPTPLYLTIHSHQQFMCSTGVCCVSTEKVALMSPDDEVQKSDVSSSSQGMVEKEALGPLLLEVRDISIFIYRHDSCVS